MEESKGCLYSGCLAALIGVAGLVVLTVLFTGGVFYWAKSKTSEAPLSFPVGDATLSVEAAEKIDAFVRGWEIGDATPLILSQDEINGFIEADEEIQGLVRVELPEDRIKLMVTFPLGEMPMFSGRFFNGEAVFYFEIEPGMFGVRVDSLTADGEPLPGFLLEEFNSSNLIDEIRNSGEPEAEEIVEALERIAEIRVEDGKLHVYPVVPS